MYRLYIFKNKQKWKNDLCIMYQTEQLGGHQCNKWDYKGTSLHKRGNENAAYGELERVRNYCTIWTFGRKKKI